MYGLDHGGWMFGGGFVMLLWWLLPVALVVFAAVYFMQRRTPDDGEKTAIDILEKEYASGKISRDEFLQKREDLARR